MKDYADKIAEKVLPPIQTPDYLSKIHEVIARAIRAGYNLGYSAGYSDGLTDGPR